MSRLRAAGAGWSRRPVMRVVRCLVPLLLVNSALSATAAMLDDLEEPTGWVAAPSEGVTLALSRDAGFAGSALRLDYDFCGHGGWAAVRKAFPLEMPANWQLSFLVRGTPRTQTLQVKLLDEEGANVWWSVRPDFRLTEGWQRVVVKKRQVSFAWGPGGGGELARLGAIELAITAGDGGSGSIWIDDLSFTPLPVPRPYDGVPALTASSSAPGADPSGAMDGRTVTAWRSTPGAGGPQHLDIDFGVLRELGGLVIDWDERLPRAPFEVQLAEREGQWSTAWKVADAHGTHSYVPLGDSAARWARVVVAAPPPAGIGIREIAVKGLRWADTPNHFLAGVAGEQRRGLYPRAMLGEASAWTLVGTGTGAGRRGLLGADGSFEPAPRSYSLEPFVQVDGELVTWADVSSAQELGDGRLPIPSVTWRHPAFSLQVTALAEDDGAALRYRLTNRTAGAITPRLVLAARPFQVDPPTQFLNLPGGAVPTGRVACTPSGVSIAGQWLGEAEPAPDHCGAVGFDGGDVVSWLAAGQVASGLRRDGSYTSAALTWDLELGPGASAEVVVTIAGEDRRTGRATVLPPVVQQPGGGASFADRAAASARAWHERLSRVEINTPPAGRELVDTMYANLAYMLVNRQGPALQPGARSYARSWIRDGAMMSAELLRLGHEDVVEAYARWFADHQYADGKVPCCVDRHGADPVAENDADGEFIFLVAETYRVTHDGRFAAELWPHVERAVAHLDSLRRSCRTRACRAPDRLAFFGLLPASISHEGYSAKPMHSYWDDLWAARGLSDAAWLAAELGKDDQAARFAVIGKQLRHDVVASLGRAMGAHAIDYLPGCAELGDFDPTSTTVALAPTGADSWLPHEPLLTTFERYWQDFVRRRDHPSAPVTYTPYELRAVGAFVRLGWRERAWELLEYIMGDRLPGGWRQWPEVVRRGQTAAHFLGDLPHTWVGSDYIRSFLDCFAYEREADQALVVGAGVPAAWLADGGVEVRGLRTRWGTLTYHLEGQGGDVRFRLGSGLSLPSGGVVLQPPLAGPVTQVVVNGRSHRPAADGRIVIRRVPADVDVETGGDGSQAPQQPATEDWSHARRGQ